MFGNGAVYPYAPWLEIWKSQEHRVATISAMFSDVDQVTIRDQAGVWIGPEISHNPAFILRNIGRNDQGSCGLGKKYKNVPGNATKNSPARLPRQNA
jgi:hypothetical protein